MNLGVFYSTSVTFVCIFAFTATASAQCTYVYDRTIELPTIGPSYPNGTPASGNGAKGLHFSNGLLYVAQNSAEIVQVVDPTDDTIVRTIYNTQSQATGTTKSNLVDVWADVAGNVWAVADLAAVPKMLYAGNGETSFTELFTLTATAYTLSKDSAGNFYAGSPDSTTAPLAKYNSAGSLVTTYPDCVGYAAMDVNDAGTTAYQVGKNSTGSELDRKLYSINTATGDYTILSESHGNTANPTGLHLDETNGYVYLSIRRTSAIGDNCVIKYDLEGNEIMRWNQWDPVTGKVSYDITNGGITDNGMDEVYGITVDEATGTVYVARNELYAVAAGEEGVSMAHVMVFNPEPLRPGDVDGNGIVDGNDAAVLAENWMMSSGATWLQGDFNGDHKVNDIDATMMAANWSGAASTASVPEPSTLALAVGGLMALCFLRKRSVN